MKVRVYLLRFGSHIGEERLDLGEIAADFSVEFSHLGAEVWRAGEQGVREVVGTGRWTC